MKEMLLVGRGGDGVVVASQILAETFASSGCWVQSFPEFKAERRGAPISAFLRWDERSQIHRRYKIGDCDVLVDVSAAPPPPDALARVRDGGLVVLNRDGRFRHAGRFDVARVPATRIAEANGIVSAEGRPMGNVAVLGACVRLLLPDGLGYLEQAIAARMGALAAANVLAARQGYAHCTRQHILAGDTPVEAPARSRVRRAVPPFGGSTEDSRGIDTGSWSLERPMLLGGCTACALCALFCPEGAIARHDGAMTVDYLHCKGCGICATVCPVRNAIAMQEAPA